MKLYFSWEQAAGALLPSCSSSVVNEDGVSPLVCLLTDDGGQKFLDTVSWLNEGASRIELIKSSKADIIDWSRDAWGAELVKGQVKIYSLYDGNYFELIRLESFEKALLAWLSFIQLQPEAGVTQEIEI